MKNSRKNFLISQYNSKASSIFTISSFDMPRILNNTWLQRELYNNQYLLSAIFLFNNIQYAKYNNTIPLEQKQISHDDIVHARDDQEICIPFMVHFLFALPSMNKRLFLVHSSVYAVASFVECSSTDAQLIKLMCISRALTHLILLLRFSRELFGEQCSSRPTIAL